MHTGAYSSGDQIDDDLTVIDLLGGSAKVDTFLCRSRRRKELVACKVLLPDFQDDESSVDAIAFEGNALVTLHHPNLVKGFGFDAETVPPRVVMEFLEGQTLKSALLTGNIDAFDVLDFVDMARQVADALQYVHESGYLHLDVKPSNLMYLDDHVTLFDFSVAERYSPDRPLRDDAGTTEYMSPEQTHRQEVGYVTDVFGLGVVFYQLLTGGELPYSKISKEEAANRGIDRQLDYEVAPAHPSELNADVPETIGDIAMRALALDKEDRFPTAADLREALNPAS